MVLTTDWASMTTARSPARCAEIAAARPHGPAPTMSRSTVSLRSVVNDLIPLRPHAHEAHRNLGELLEPVEVPTRPRRRVAHLARVGGRRLPALHPLVVRGHSLERGQVGREFADVLAIAVIAGADRDPVERVEHIELGDGQMRQAVLAR